VALALEHSLVQGVYTGWKPHEDLTPDDKSDSWFRIHKLTVKGQSVVIQASPRTIRDGEVFASASDGGFLTYKGTLYKKGGELRIKMRVVKADYVGAPDGGWPELDLPVQIKDQVSFKLDGVTYLLQGREDRS
jgi:hypothetical protein